MVLPTSEVSDTRKCFTCEGDDFRDLLTSAPIPISFIITASLALALASSFSVIALPADVFAALYRSLPSWYLTHW